MIDINIDEWRRMPSYFLCSDARIGDTWGLGPVIRTRDSSILETSNADAIERILTEAEERGDIGEDTWCITGASHWAHGWVDHVSVLLEENGEPSRVLVLLQSLLDAILEYPILDDSAFSEAEYEAAQAGWSEFVRWEAGDELSDNALCLAQEAGVPAWVAYYSTNEGIQYEADLRDRSVLARIVREARAHAKGNV